MGVKGPNSGESHGQGNGKLKMETGARMWITVSQKCGTLLGGPPLRLSSPVYIKQTLTHIRFSVENIEVEQVVGLLPGGLRDLF